MKLLCLLLFLSAYLGNSQLDHSKMAASRFVPRGQPNCVKFKNLLPGYAHSAWVESDQLVPNIQDKGYMTPGPHDTFGQQTTPWPGYMTEVQVASTKPEQWIADLSNKVTVSCAAECTLTKTETGTHLDCVEPKTGVETSSERCKNNKCALVTQVFTDICDMWEASNG